MSMTLEQAMRRAFSLGQTYCEQADSESWSKQDKAEGTRLKFEQLLQETLTQPAQSVDVEKVKEVIADLTPETWGSPISLSGSQKLHALRNKLTAALQEKGK